MTPHVQVCLSAGGHVLRRRVETGQEPQRAALQAVQEQAGLKGDCHCACSRAIPTIPTVLHRQCSIAASRAWQATLCGNPHCHFAVCSASSHVR